jgi:hypothetical protein
MFVVGQFTAGVSYRKLATQFQVDRRTVARIFEIHKVTSTVESCVSSGRPRITNDIEDRMIVSEVRAVTALYDYV